MVHNIFTSLMGAHCDDAKLSSSSQQDVCIAAAASHTCKGLPAGKPDFWAGVYAAHPPQDLLSPQLPLMIIHVICISSKHVYAQHPCTA